MLQAEGTTSLSANALPNHFSQNGLKALIPAAGAYFAG
jgi:hypothetical protein